MKPLEKNYTPSDIEPRWAEAWKNANSFASGQVDGDPWTLMMPPPNVTGSLHIGHALTYSLQDILVRYQRMNGKDTLWQPGKDHAGIATQMVVERQLAEEGKTRHDLGREAFVERVWKWKEESGNTIFDQLSRLGSSADWARERFTMDEGLSAAVRKVFVKLHKEKLIYRDKRLVNWDVKLHTAISDLEVVQKEVDGHMWHIKYPVEGQDGKFITVATTRPETMLGDTAIAVHPEDERYTDLVGKNVTLPLVGRLIPIVADEYSDPEKGTGAVKITPAHDFNDFEVGKRHELPMINILDGNGHINDEVPEKYRGMDRFVARDEVVKDLKALGLLDAIEDETHMVPFGDRSNTIIEPWLTDQWFVDAETLAKDAIEAVETGRTKFVPKNWDKTYYEWMRNIQPWCISRQIWWGHRIPAWYGPDGTFFVEETEKEAQAAAKAHYGKKLELTRDPDVLDTWFSSALWPFSTLGWPDKTPELDRHYPTDVLVTGFDIIFFWVARMMMMGLHFMDEVPFKTVYIHALVRDEQGQKMSKSKGNIIDPMNMMNEQGADAMRFTLAAMAAPGRDIKLAHDRVEGYRKFGTKLWNAARFLQMHTEAAPVKVLSTSYIPPVKTPDEQHIVAKLNETIQQYRKNMETFRFNDVANLVYSFMWHQYCDWFVEYSKPTLHKGERTERERMLEILHYSFANGLRLLHPLMPHITEELWEGMGYAEAEGLLVTSQQLKPRSTKQLVEIGIDEDVVDYVEAKHDLIRVGRLLRADYNIVPKQKADFILRPGENQHHDRLHADISTLSATLNASELKIDAKYQAEKAMPSGVSKLGTIYMSVEKLIDVDAEIQKLTSQLEEATNNLERVNRKLSNEGFISKAPREVVEVQENRKVELIEQIEKLQKLIKTLAEAV